MKRLFSDFTFICVALDVPPILSLSLSDASVR